MDSIDNLDELSYDSLNNYFKTIVAVGYKSHNEVDKLILLLFIKEFTNSPFSLYIDEEDYNTINNVLNCLYGTTCLIPYPKFKLQRSLIQELNLETPRNTEDEIIRFSARGNIRLMN